MRNELAKHREQAWYPQSKRQYVIPLALSDSTRNAFSQYAR